MTKRKKGQKPYESSHPTRIEMPDVPGHQQKRGIVVNNEQKRELEEQVKRLKRELHIGENEEGGAGRLK